MILNYLKSSSFILILRYCYCILSKLSVNCGLLTPDPVVKIALRTQFYTYKKTDYWNGRLIFDSYLNFILTWCGRCLFNYKSKNQSSVFITFSAKFPNFLVWKFCEKEQFLHSFGRFAGNYAETVPFHKISTPGN